jgi:hypothetical protein
MLVTNTASTAGIKKLWHQTHLSYWLVSSLVALGTASNMVDTMVDTMVDIDVSETGGNR